MLAALPAPDTAFQWLLVAIALAGELLAVVFVYRVLIRGGSPASTLLWMVVILVAPWIGLFLYYLLPRRLHLRRLSRLRKHGARYRAARSPKATANGAAAGRNAAEPAMGLASLLAGADGSGLSPGNALRWLPDGGQFEAATAAAIAAATKTVHFVVYILRTDASGQRFLALLVAAARRGVKVRLLYDSIGSWWLKTAHLAELRAAGGRAEPFLPLLWKRRPFTMNLRNHRKLLVVDGEVAILGGRNVGDEYFTDRLGRQRKWQDAMLEVRGPAVERLQEVFVEDWCTATEEVLSDEVFRPASAGKLAVGVVCSGPTQENSDLWFALIQAIGEAKATIDLNSPYLVPPPTLLFALQLASSRGVRVRIFTNGPKTEGALLYHAQRSYYKQLMLAGVQIYETTSEYNHAKMIVVDDKTVLVGSANMDLRSAHLNFEIAAVAVDAPELAAEVMKTLAARAADCTRLTAAHLPKKPWARALDGFCGLFSPLL
jgi:cardiolipin synthase A/B